MPAERPGFRVAFLGALFAALVVPPVSRVALQTPAARPNILFLIADDWAWPHAGAYGDRVVRTPVFDRVAREGALFTHAFSAAPSCTPSRASMLTGRAVHALEAGGNLHSALPTKFAVYPDLLEDAGYTVGFTRKGWGPGDLKTVGRTRNPAGDQFPNFDEFLARVPAGRPFAFWFGSQDPHRPYTPGTGAQAGLRAEDVMVPAFLPDTPEIRQDLLDYYFEVERFDREVGQILATLEKRGVLDQTLVVITGDNGMPFPRAKANVYDGGSRQPLAVRWPGHVPAGRVIDAFVVLTDLAPTFLEAAGLPRRSDMDGRSWMGLLKGESQPARDRVFLERERHANVRRGDLSYPVRAVRTRDFLYIRNLRPDRWPAGDPELYFSVGPFGDIDGSPSKDLLMSRQGEPAIRRYFDLAMGRRPAEELYDLRVDPGQVTNVIDQSRLAETRRALRESLDRWMTDTADPRATRDDDRWDRYAYFGAPAAGR
jgi:arylsulfatase A-like enzyme